jgi:hypothetical protein
MKTVHIFNPPLHVLGNKSSVSDIDGLKIFNSEAKDTFDLSAGWKSNSGTLPGFTYVLRAVLTNLPNSCPPERLFIIFNATYNDDQKSSYTDYIELSMQSQFNKRAL